MHNVMTGEEKKKQSIFKRIFCFWKCNDCDKKKDEDAKRAENEVTTDKNESPADDSKVAAMGESKSSIPGVADIAPQSRPVSLFVQRGEDGTSDVSLSSDDSSTISAEAAPK